MTSVVSARSAGFVGLVAAYLLGGVSALSARAGVASDGLQLKVTTLTRAPAHFVTIVVRATNETKDQVFVGNGPTTLTWTYRNGKSLIAGGYNPESLSINSYGLLQPSGDAGDSTLIEFCVPEDSIEEVIQLHNSIDGRGTMSIGWNLDCLTRNEPSCRFRKRTREAQVDFKLTGKLEVHAKNTVE